MLSYGKIYIVNVLIHTKGFNMVNSCNLNRYKVKLYILILYKGGWSFE